MGLWQRQANLYYMLTTRVLLQRWIMHDCLIVWLLPKIILTTLFTRPVLVSIIWMGKPRCWRETTEYRYVCTGICDIVIVRYIILLSCCSPETPKSVNATLPGTTELREIYRGGLGVYNVTCNNTYIERTRTSHKSCGVFTTQQNRDGTQI